VRRIRATPPVRRAPLLLEDLRTLLAPMVVAAAKWPAGVAARRDMALLLMGFAGAHRRSELTALTLGDVALHRSDGLHVRLRSSMTEQEAHGSVKALPFGRDPATCPPCAFVRWREVLHAADTADPDDPRAQRKAMLRVLHRQTAATRTASDGGGGGEQRPAADDDDDDQDSVLHVCRTTRVKDPADPGAGAVPGDPQDRRHRHPGHVWGCGERDDPPPRRRGGVHPRTDPAVGCGHSLRAGFVTEAFRAGADAHAIMRQTGHRSPAMLEVYAREHAPSSETPSSLGL